jgi:proline dehydrogenase
MLATRFTGAGPRVAQALAQGREPPQQLTDAMDAICKRAAAQQSRVWVDAEQQVFQPTIDRWTTDLMRRHNKNGYALISLTVQAYLKSTRSTVEQLLKQAQRDDFTLGIKLVRGTKEEEQEQKHAQKDHNNNDAWKISS